MADVQLAANRPIARQRAAAAAREARDAARNAPAALARDAARRSIRVESDLAAVVDRAAERVAFLQSNLSAAKARLGRMDDNSFHSGNIHEGAAVVRNQIAGLPALIARAETELTAAHHALAAHRTAMHAAADADEDAKDGPEDAAETQLDPVPAGPQRGRGRPPKVVS